MSLKKPIYTRGIRGTGEQSSRPPPSPVKEKSTVHKYIHHCLPTLDTIERKKPGLT